MSNEKLQEAFEAWYSDYVGLDSEEIKGWRKADGYSGSYERCNISWLAWQASRAALEIDLPDNFDPDGGGQWAMWQDLVVRSIEDAGAKVKP